MMMTHSSPSLFFCETNHTAIIRVKGRANFSLSPHFKNLVGELRSRGSAKFILDLTECSTMDSTFLGIMAGLAIDLSGGNERPSAPVLELCGANERVRDLLENLGISHFFCNTEAPLATTETFNPVLPLGPAASKREVSQTCLAAHETLMAANPDNVPKFKDVTQFLAADLEKLTRQTEPPKEGS